MLDDKKQIQKQKIKKQTKNIISASSAPRFDNFINFDTLPGLALLRTIFCSCVGKKAKYLDMLVNISSLYKTEVLLQKKKKKFF